MLEEGIEENKEGNENQNQETAAEFEFVSQQAKGFVFKTDGGDEAMQAQAAYLLLQNYTYKCFKEQQANSIPGWSDGNPEGDMSDDDGDDDEHDEEDEKALMDDIKQHAALLPTQVGKDSSEPLLISIEDHAKLTSDAKARLKSKK